jgi:hypothetical protein
VYIYCYGTSQSEVVEFVVPDLGGGGSGGSVNSLSGMSKGIELSISALAGHSNFHPQGMAYDGENNQLVLAPQGKNMIILLNADTFSVESTLYLAGRTTSYATGVAVDANNYYITEYNSNNGYMLKCPKSGKSGSSIYCSDDAQIAGYGGVPLTVTGSTLYRAARDSSGSGSNSYSWDNLRTLVKSDASSPTSIQSSCNLPSGTDGLAFVGGNKLIQMVWNGDSGTAQPTLNLIDADTCAVESTQTLANACDSGSNAAGVAYKAGKVYIYCWGNGLSHVSRYSVKLC